MTRLRLITLLLFAVTDFCNGQSLSLPGRSVSYSSSSSDEGTVIDMSREATLKGQLDEVGLEVANKLMRCCSSYGGNNLSAEIDYSGIRLNSLTQSYTIPMTVHWYGSMTGGHYWIRGKLKIAGEGRMQWLKLNDSGGFSSGCSAGCIN